MKTSVLTAAMILAAMSPVAAPSRAVAGDERSPPASVTAADGAGRLAVPPVGTPANQGYKLFMLNCAHCHGTDARGDEGPDLHGVTKSDQRIIAIIRNGIKGEMPRFGAKLDDAGMQALVAFIRTLKEE